MGNFSQVVGIWTTSLNCNPLLFRAQVLRTGLHPGAMAWALENLQCSQHERGSNFTVGCARHRSTQIPVHGTSSSQAVAKIFMDVDEGRETNLEEAQKQLFHISQRDLQQ